MKSRLSSSQHVRLRCLSLAAAPHAAEPVALYQFLKNATSAAALLTVDQTHNLRDCLLQASPLAEWAHEHYHALHDAATLEHSDLALLVAAVALARQPSSTSGMCSRAASITFSVTRSVRRVRSSERASCQPAYAVGSASTLISSFLGELRVCMREACRRITPTRVGEDRDARDGVHLVRVVRIFAERVDGLGRDVRRRDAAGRVERFAGRRARGVPKESRCALRGGFSECGVVRARVEPGDRRSGVACLAEASGDGGRRWKVDGDDVIGAASLWSGRRSDRIWFFDATMRIAARARVVRVRHTDRGELDLVLERAEITRALR